MGRINLTPLRVRRRALANLESRRTTIRPIWLELTGDIPPAQVLTRQQPQQHPVIQVRSETILPKEGSRPGALPRIQQIVRSKNPKSYNSKRKPSKLFSPVQIRYEEDELRKHFFSDHPWELARPRVVLETNGNQHREADWSTGLIQPGIPLSGESVIQRQLHFLASVPDITVSRAYDLARREFYDLRRQEDIRRRIAAEEAQATGAYFGKNILHWGMEIENKQYDDWEKWSRAAVAEQMQRTAAFAGATMAVEEENLSAIEANDRRTGSSLFMDEDAKRQGQYGKKRIIE